MSIVQSEIYDAFIEAGTSEPKLRTAAEVVARKPHDVDGGRDCWPDQDSPGLKRLSLMLYKT